MTTTGCVERFGPAATRARRTYVFAQWDGNVADRIAGELGLVGDVPAAVLDARTAFLACQRASRHLPVIEDLVGPATQKTLRAVISEAVSGEVDYDRIDVTAITKARQQEDAQRLRREVAARMVPIAAAMFLATVADNEDGVVAGIKATHAERIAELWVLVGTCPGITEQQALTGGALGTAWARIVTFVGELEILRHLCTLVSHEPECADPTCNWTSDSTVLDNRIYPGGGRQTTRFGFPGSTEFYVGMATAGIDPAIVWCPTPYEARQAVEKVGRAVVLDRAAERLGLTV
jgi:hypothetical protein